MNTRLADWLKKVRPSYVAAGERTWPAPVGARRWDVLAELCGDAEEVLGYTAENGLLGAWRKPIAEQSSAAPQGAELLAMIKEVMGLQTSVLREVIQTQTALMKSVREAAEATSAFRVRIPAVPTESEEGDEEEGALDGAVAAALQQAMAKGFGGAPPPDGQGKP